MVAAGRDHDLINIYCNDIFELPGNSTNKPVKVCNPLTIKKYTKMVVKVHVHPKYDITARPVAEQTKEPDPIVKSFVKSSFDIALVEIEPFELSSELNILPGCLLESNVYSFGSKLLAAGPFHDLELTSPDLSFCFFLKI